MVLHHIRPALPRRDYHHFDIHLDHLNHLNHYFDHDYYDHFYHHLPDHDNNDNHIDYNFNEWRLVLLALCWVRQR